MSTKALSARLAKGRDAVAAIELEISNYRETKEDELREHIAKFMEQYRRETGFYVCSIGVRILAHSDGGEVSGHLSSVQIVDSSESQ